MERIKKIGSMISAAKVRVITITVILVFGLATIFAAAANSSTVEVNVDGTVHHITTLRTDAYEVLTQANVEIGENDIVDLTDFVGGSDSVIKVFKAYNITVFDNGSDGVEVIGNGTVADTLKKAGYILNDGDELNVSLDEKIYEGMEIAISRAFQVIINADGENYIVNIASGTVGDALNKAVLTIDNDDIISKPLDTVLTKGMAVKITRIELVKRTETVEIPFKTTTKKDANMTTSQSKVEVKGVKGQKTVTYEDKYIDGELKESTAVSTVVDKQPVDEVKIVGTKKVVATSGSGVVLANGVKTISRLTPPASLQLNGTVPTSYKKKIVGTASAYSGGGRTATGRAVMPGYIAVNPKQIPYHTKMWIVSNDGKYVYGYASAEDTGGFTKWTGSRATLCDLYFPTSAQTSAFGRRSVTIYVL